MTMPQFVSGSELGGGAQPSFRHLGKGRLVALRALSYNPEAPGYKGGAPKPAVTYDMVVLDGPAFTYGDTASNDGTPLTPPTLRMDRVPALFYSCVASQVWFTQRIQRLVGTGQWLIGRVNKRSFDGGNPAWCLDDPSEADKAAVMAWWTAAFGPVPSWTNPQPVELAVQPGSAYVAHGGTSPARIEAELNGQYPTHPGQAPAPPVYQPIPQPAQVNYAAPAPTVPPQFQAIWHTFTPDQQAAILASSGGQPAAVAPAQPPF